MKFGLVLPQVGFKTGRAPIIEMAQAAEEVGFDSVWVGDHLALPDADGGAYPYNAAGDLGVAASQPFFEAFTTLAFVAGITQRVRLGVGVSVLPYRSSVLLAKQIATIDQLSEGRFILGGGAGWLEKEFLALGVSFRDRGRLTDERLDFLRRLWTADQAQPFSFGASDATVDALHLAPGPYQSREVPVWVGGGTKAARRRSAQFGDVWLPHVYHSPPELLEGQLSDIQEAAVRFGRPGDVGLALFAPIAGNEQADGRPPWERGAFSGELAELRTEIAAYEAVGVDTLILNLPGSQPTRLATLNALAEEGVLAA